jgi:hypothetical protein
MSTTEVLGFADALKHTDPKKRKLLLGNGFSMAWNPKVFAYGSLFEAAKKSMSGGAQATFAGLKTSNFELVMRVLRDASKLVTAIDSKYAPLAAELEKYAIEIREALIKTVAANHPDAPKDVTDDEAAACRQFLANFECWYTLNYDLLLYWVLMRAEVTPKLKLEPDDGFRMPYSGPDEYVSWEVERSNKQKLHYLHGGLHIFDTGTEFQKYTWINTGVRLIDQIRDALSKGKFPLFVSEGSSAEKKEHILHSGFLHRPLRSISNIGGSLFLYGVSLAENDDHILKQIERGTNALTVAVGLYKGKDGYNQDVIKRAEAIKTARNAYNSQKPINLFFYDTASANVWGR